MVLTWRFFCAKDEKSESWRYTEILKKENIKPKRKRKQTKRQKTKETDENNTSPVK